MTNPVTTHSHPDDDRRDHSGAYAQRFPASSIGGGHACFRPADDEPVAIGAGQGVSPCHHPSEPGDGLAAGLHRTLTEFEQQHLAVLSSRS